MSNSIAPGSSADVNVKVTALTTNPNIPVTYKTIILKKNLVNGVNTLTQEMMSTTNTKYVVKYDYVLGEDIIVPSNCILEFDGGSISGSQTLTGNNTAIKADLVKIFDNNITIDGSWEIDGAYPEWFGASNDQSVDSTLAIQKVLDTRSFLVMRLSNSRYVVNDIDNDGYCLIMTNYTHILGNNKSEITHSDNTNPILFKIAIDWNRGYTEARGLMIDSVNFSNYDANWAVDFETCLTLHNLCISNCSFYSASGQPLKISRGAGVGHSLITNCRFEGSSQIFMWDRVIIEKSDFYGAGCALNLESEDGCINNTIQNNTITNYGGAITLTNCVGARILNNQIEQGQDTDSTHEKKCSIYLKGTSTFKLKNIIISNNNLGGGSHLYRSIYMEHCNKVIVDNNRICDGCTQEDIYIASNCRDCVIRKSNFYVTQTTNELNVNDSGIGTCGTKRKFINPIDQYVGNLTFTKTEDGLLVFNSGFNNTIIGQGTNIGTFPEGYKPFYTKYKFKTADSIEGIVEVTYAGKLIGVSNPGNNSDMYFPIMQCRTDY